MNTCLMRYQNPDCGGDYIHAVLQNEKHLAKFQSVSRCLEAEMLMQHKAKTDHK